MGIVQKTIKFIEKQKQEKTIKQINSLLSYLNELKILEANLWGINIIQLQNTNEEVLEDTNHLIYLISKEKHHPKLKEILIKKEIKEFTEEIKKLKEDFNHLKKKIKEKNQLKNLISNFTIKIVEPQNYSKMKNIFLLEKKLYEIIEEQDKELEELFKEINHIKLNNKEEKVEHFIKTLKNIRTILAGHQDIHHLWNKERIGYSDTSNILYELTKIVKENIKKIN